MSHSEQITFAIIFHSDDYAIRIDCPESTWTVLTNVLESNGFLSSDLLRWELTKNAITVVGEKSMTREILDFLLAQRFVSCNVSIAYRGDHWFCGRRLTSQSHPTSLRQLRSNCRSAGKQLAKQLGLKSSLKGKQYGGS